MVVVASGPSALVLSVHTEVDCTPRNSITVLLLAKHYSFKFITRYTSQPSCLSRQPENTVFVVVATER